MPIESWPDFGLGVISTLILVVIVNFLTKTYQRYTKEIEAANKPQQVIQKTEKTPKEVVDAADAARVKRLLFFGALVVLWLALLYSLFPGLFENLVAILDS
ncbi:MAG: hypothetical protein KF832_14025 [Caldilineaceae bacterium]|nr:hypothetical protein [Caldilineaceae bacterium]